MVAEVLPFDLSSHRKTDTATAIRPVSNLLQLWAWADKPALLPCVNQSPSGGVPVRMETLLRDSYRRPLGDCTEVLDLGPGYLCTCTCSSVQKRAPGCTPLQLLAVGIHNRNDRDDHRMSLTDLTDPYHLLSSTVSFHVSHLQLLISSLVHLSSNCSGLCHSNRFYPMYASKIVASTSISMLQMVEPTV